MQELHLVGFTTDLEQLIFSVRKGAKSGGYTVGLDEQLLTVIAEAVRMRRAVGADVSEAAAAVEAAVREGSAASAAKAESALTPREIQARLRSGRSVKQVAKAASVSEAWIERFAAPVRAEQGQMAQRARALVFSKPRLGESAEPLGLSVRWNVAEKGVRFTEHEFDEHWSAYQFQDHVWVIRFAFESRKREHVAEWVLDLETTELTHRNRLASDLGYLEPGKRRKIADLVPEPADVAVETSHEPDADDDDAGRRSSRPAGRRPAKRAAKKSTTKKAAAKKAGAKKAAAKKAGAKRATRKKAAAKKSPARKAAGKKSTAKKTAARKTAARKAAAKKAGAKMTGAKKAAARKSTAKKSTAKKSTAKKAAGKKTAAKKTAARKSSASRPPAAPPAESSGSPWQSFSAGTTVPAAPPPASRASHTAGQATPPPQAEGRTTRRAARRGQGASPGPRAGTGATSERPAHDQQDPAPPVAPEAAEVRSDTGQVVTIRANRATPPIAERRDHPRRAPATEADEGVVADPTPLRPALQARPPRRRRYGNRS